MRSLWRRLAGFAGLPVISMVTPLLVLPVLGRQAGAAGWASIVAGESVGTLAAIVVAYGWNTAGPPRVALAADDPALRAHYYAESLVVRGALAVAAVPVIVVVCLLLAADGFALPTVLMGFAGAVTGLSFAWYAVGAGDPRSIAVYEAVPRVVAAAVSAAVILATHVLAVYPLLALAASLGGVWAFSRRVLATPHAPVGARQLRGLLVRDRGVAAIDIAGGAWSTVPVPAVSAIAAAPLASAYASADKLYKYGLYLPISLGNAFQSWTVEGHPSQRGRRLRAAFGAHLALGLAGWAFLAALGPWFSALLFGAEVAAARSVCFWLGATFLLVSCRISLTRHVLIPVGQVRVVLRSTVAGALVGAVLLAALTPWLGPVGAALALCAGEVVTTGMQVPPAARHVGALPAAAVAEGGTR